MLQGLMQRPPESVLWIQPFIRIHLLNPPKCYKEDLSHHPYSYHFNSILFEFFRRRFSVTDRYELFQQTTDRQIRFPFQLNFSKLFVNEVFDWI